MITFTEILGCDGTALYESDNQTISFKTSGRLQLLIAYDGMIMLRMEDFEYGINGSDQIIYDDQDPQYKMVLHLKRYPKGKWIVKINEHMDQIYSCLNQKCYLKLKNQNKNQFSSSSSSKSEVKVTKKENVKKEQKKQYDEKKYYDLEEEDQMQKKQRKSITPGEAIITASKGLGWGLAMTGKLLSKGFQAIGGAASKVVTPATEKVQVSENTKANLELAKKTTKSVFNFTATQVGNIFAFGKETVSNLGQKFEKSEKGQQLQQNPRYENIKSGAKTGVKAFSNIYSGIVNGVYEMGSGISKGTSQVVSKKYGEDAGKATDDLFQGAGNIVKIVRVPEDQAAQTFKD